MELYAAKLTGTQPRRLKGLTDRLELTEGGYYQLHEYNGTVAVRGDDWPNTCRIYLSHYHVEHAGDRIRLKFDPDLRVWYDTGGKGRSAVGINQCGTCFFEAEDSNGRLIARSADLRVSSNLMTEQAFSMMHEDIANKLEFVMSSNGGPVRDVQVYDDEWKRLVRAHKQMNLLMDHLAGILLNPAEELRTERVQKEFHKLRKVTVRSLLEKRMRPYKQKVRTIEKVASSAVEEHRMIRWGLNRLDEYYSRTRRRLLREADWYKNRHQSMSRLAARPVDDGFDSFERRQIRQSLQADLTALEERRQHLLGKLELVETILADVHRCMGEALLQVEPKELEMTHLFHFSPDYADVFYTLQSLFDEQLGGDIMTTSQALQKSPILYEVWTLLAIIQSLIEDCGFRPVHGTHIYEAIQATMVGGKPLEGLALHFDRPAYSSLKKSLLSGMTPQRLKLTLKYEATIERAAREYRPDYTFIFEEEDTRQQRVAYLDAKYKEFEREDGWLDELRAVSYLKYYKTVEPKPIASFLVHPKIASSKTVNPWNVKLTSGEEIRHRFGSFELRPDQTGAFKKWMTMLLHYHLGYDGVCPNCSTTEAALFEMKKSWKRYHTCSNVHCQAFWVVSICFNRTGNRKSLEDAHHSDTSRLFKYTRHSNINYHMETDRNWDVHCPVCEKSLADLNSSRN